GFDHPDFMKLLHFSAIDGTLKIFIPHIVWEERRTQLLDEANSSRRKLRDSFEALSKQLATNIVLRGLASPALNVWSESEIEAWSREAMKSFATANKIEIVSLAPDHAERAWDRYFTAQPPFNRDEERKNRRKDIPDSWIFEAAIDVAKKHPGLLALVPDGKLSNALKSNGIKVLNELQQVLDEIDRHLILEVVTDVVEVQDSVSVSIQETATVAILGSELDLALAGAREPFKHLDKKILGYVGYLGTSSKDQLFALLARSEIPVEIAKNVVERLVIAGVIMDTGNHYISRNKAASDLAASSVEPEIIKLLEEI
ncbi:MAG: PIN domain-containing protein, partial [Nitrospiraceae bacterium]